MIINSALIQLDILLVFMCFSKFLGCHWLTRGAQAAPINFTMGKDQHDVVILSGDILKSFQSFPLRVFFSQKIKGQFAVHISFDGEINHYIAL